MTIVAVDVAYDDDDARAAGVSFAAFTDAEPAETTVIEYGRVAPYVPGSLYLRELPPLRAVLDFFSNIEVVIVDGHVELGDGPGLGAHLQASLRKDGIDVVVIGVAKNPYRGAPAVEVLRGTSERPLYVTAAGMPVDEAAAHVRSMHGPHRLPTLLKLADTLTRQPSISP
ncbi:MAG: endonuclease V [Deltaproteobacteria bacterium]|jgi:deoxyribonuclease V